MEVLIDVTFEVASVPKGQPRVRATTFGRHARMYTPGTARPFKDAVAHAALATELRGRMPMRNPTAVWTVCFMPRPKRLLTKRTAGLRDVPCIAKPDRDNLDKAVLDALVNAGILHDDSIVFDGGVRKVYADAGDAPRAVIRVIEYGDTDHG